MLAYSEVIRIQRIFSDRRNGSIKGEERRNLSGIIPELWPYTGGFSFFGDKFLTKISQELFVKGVTATFRFREIVGPLNRTARNYAKNHNINIF